MMRDISACCAVGRAHVELLAEGVPLIHQHLELAQQGVLRLQQQPLLRSAQVDVLQQAMDVLCDGHHPCTV